MWEDSEKSRKEISERVKETMKNSDEIKSWSSRKK